ADGARHGRREGGVRDRAGRLRHADLRGAAEAARDHPRPDARRAGSLMPELPEMQALSERLDEWLRGARVESVEPLGFAALKTVVPAPDSLVGLSVQSVGRRAKYLVFTLDGGVRLLVHLSQAGRLDVESPPKRTRPKGAAVRVRFDGDRAMLVREHG